MTACESFAAGDRKDKPFCLPAPSAIAVERFGGMYGKKRQRKAAEEDILPPSKVPGGLFTLPPSPAAGSADLAQPDSQCAHEWAGEESQAVK
jgi:hypothetical protein